MRSPLGHMPDGMRKNPEKDSHTSIFFWGYVEIMVFTNINKNLTL
mgnify:CR=1 FL=1